MLEQLEVFGSQLWIIGGLVVIELSLFPTEPKGAIGVTE